MKKILAFILAALMAVPFAVAASADAPEEPVLTSDKAFTVAAAKTNANPNFPDLTPDKYGTKAQFWQDFFGGSLKNGGKFIIAGKGYLAESATLPKTSSPVVFTSIGKDGKTNYASFNEDGSYNTVDGKGAAGGGQYGSLMLKGDVTLTFGGDVIFDDVVIFNRDNKLAHLKAQGKLVIKSNVKFAEKTPGQGYSLEVAEGGVAFLHALGFITYTGKGTIVIGDEIKDKVTAEAFSDFGGELIYADGSKVEGFTPNPNTPADSSASTAPSAPTTSAPADTDAVTRKPSITIRKPKTEAPDETVTASPETEAPAKESSNNGVIIGIAVGVGAAAAVAVAVVLVISKKKKAG